MFPALSEAMDQMYVEGAVYKDLKAGANSRLPLLRMATPVAVPFVSSSNFDCSQVRVPSPKANCVSNSAKRTAYFRVWICKSYTSLCDCGAGNFRVTRFLR